jgi:hypothetical protein
MDEIQRSRRARRTAASTRRSTTRRTSTRSPRGPGCRSARRSSSVHRRCEVLAQTPHGRALSKRTARATTRRSNSGRTRRRAAAAAQIRACAAWGRRDCFCPRAQRGPGIAMATLRSPRCAYSSRRAIRLASGASAEGRLCNRVRGAAQGWHKRAKQVPFSLSGTIGPSRCRPLAAEVRRRLVYFGSP